MCWFLLFKTEWRKILSNFLAQQCETAAVYPGWCNDLTVYSASKWCHNIPMAGGRVTGKWPSGKGLGMLVESSWTWTGVPRWPRPVASWPVSGIMWPTGPGQWLSCAWHWWGHTSSAVSSSGPLRTRQTLRCWNRSREALEHSSWEEQLSGLGVFSLEKRSSGGASWLSTTPREEGVAKWGVTLFS